MRPGIKVAGAVVLAALALGVLPGLAGSRTPRPERLIDAAALQAVLVSASADEERFAIEPLDPAFRSDGFAVPADVFVEPGVVQAAPQGRPAVLQPRVAAGVALKPPRYTLEGTATFYDNGTTAMRLPRGTVVIVCGPGGCIQRVVTDYGPVRTDRVIDLYRPDFFRICGCPSWSGTIWVTVKVY